DFQKLSVGNSDVVGQFHRDSDVFRGSEYNVTENFGVLEGLYNSNGFSGNGVGFQSSVYRDEQGVKDFRLGGIKGGGNLADSFGSNSGYAAMHGHHNYLINLPLDGMSQIGDECFGNVGVPFLGGNKYCDPLPVYGSGDFRGNVSILKGGECNSNGGVIPKGDVGYGNGMFESGYGPHVVGDPLQQYMLDGCKEMLNPWGNSQNVSMYNKPGFNEAFLEQYGRQYPGNVGSLGSVDPSQLMYYKQGLSRGNAFYNSMREKMRAVEEREGPLPVTLMRRPRNLESYGSERTSILRDKGFNGAIGKNCQLGGLNKNLLSGNTVPNIGERNFELNVNVPLQTKRACENGSHVLDPLMVQALYKSLVEVRGRICNMAKDQHGCRFLQKKFDEGSFEDVQLIFNEIIDHVVELMMNSFGNYLIQKLLDVCNDEQRMRIVHMVTKNRGELVKVSLNTHGTRVVQKLIESLKSRKQISLVIRALEPGFIDLIKDLNGNHVVQRCLQCLSSDDNKFIFDAAAKYSVEIATHRHGCCVLQRCIAHSTGEHQQKLLEQICSNGLILAQDPFGNYVVQYILELKIPSAAAQLVSQLEGNFVHLSMQKFSSHVVEKCFKFYEESHARIVYELLSVSHFEQLVQDPYANYVIQSALENTKGTLYESLATAVRPHSMLRTNPYGKKIFSRGLLKK
uniref:PUM-HD domain-containing protein n=2 Tax=Chenopodium quinoa TaxID=63459 RepID=A0A803ME54_CHEQI